jgi:CheY-like chemotaxis protein
VLSRSAVNAPSAKLFSFEFPVILAKHFETPDRCSMAQILVVDDVPTNIAILVELLRLEHSTQVATSGEKALALAAGDSPPDLILLDVDMPEMDGFEVCSKLKELDKTRRIPVIFVTAMDDHINEEMGFKLGAVDYITKPVKPALVLVRIRLHLRLALHQRLLEQLLDRGEDNLALSPTERELLDQLHSLKPDF